MPLTTGDIVMHLYARCNVQFGDLFCFIYGALSFSLSIGPAGLEITSASSVDSEGKRIHIFYKQYSVLKCLIYGCVWLPMFYLFYSFSL